MNGISKKKFVLILAVILVTGFCVTSFVSYFVAHKTLSDQMEENTLPLTSDNIYSEIQQDLLRPIFISSLMASDTFLRDWTLAGEEDTEQLVRYLKEIQDRYQTITSFFVSENTRKYYHSSGVLKKVDETDPQDAWYFRVRNMPTTFETNVDKDTADKNSLTVFINYKVFDYNGNYIGATGVGLGVDAVKRLIETYQKRYGRRIYFVNRQGEITLHGNLLHNVSNLREIPGLAKLATQILTAPSSALTYQDQAKNIYLNSRLVPEFNWYLVVEQDEDEAAQLILQTLLINLGIALGITVMVMMVANVTIGGYQRKLEEMASTDKLTGVANRQIFDMVFDQSTKISKRRNQPLCAVLIDIDNFKLINDRYGHIAGDEVIRIIAMRLRNMMRESDIICRWGGEEFLILLNDCDLGRCQDIAEKLRAEIERLPIRAGSTEIPVTASFGITQYVANETRTELIKRADHALYAAKNNGRNQVRAA